MLGVIVNTWPGRAWLATMAALLQFESWLLACIVLQFAIDFGAGIVAALYRTRGRGKRVRRRAVAIVWDRAIWQLLAFFALLAVGTVVANTWGGRLQALGWVDDFLFLFVSGRLLWQTIQSLFPGTESDSVAGLLAARFPVLRPFFGNLLKTDPLPTEISDAPKKRTPRKRQSPTRGKAGGNG